MLALPPLWSAEPDKLMYAGDTSLQQVLILGCHLPVMPQERLEGSCGLKRLSSPAAGAASAGS